MGKLRLALAASIVLNLFLAGALIAGLVSLRGGSRMINAGVIRIAGAELPVSVRQPFRAALRQTRRAMRPTIVAARVAKVDAARLLRAPTVDGPAVDAALDRARAADMAVRTAVERRAVAFAVTLSAADRARLADAMESRADGKRARPR
ncbi:periplasmic heavy metal sensor [Sphingomonas sp. LR60]|uniref:periplasmic heavy metal sensor n=1 Tax=Sphingomonas sp. LR60 TaxID=3050233 RepID=UPI002FDF213D